ncbi:hypothetical protein [Streptomyces griseoaurantiacus]|uniref:hypothetical protein n=1 Tax=Streptomyces griseoaurantiacus TaxID=68213 RepID=UPI0036B24546
MDGAERQEAAAQLLSGERDEDEVAGRGAPSQDAVKQFGGELGALCGQAGDDALLAGLADELYASNRAFYRL